MKTHGAAVFYLVEWCVCTYIYMSRLYTCHNSIIYMVYTSGWYIPVICTPLTYGWYIHGKPFMGLSCSFFNNDILLMSSVY